MKFTKNIFAVTIFLFCFACQKKLPKGLEPIGKLFDGDGVWYIRSCTTDGVDSAEYFLPGKDLDKEMIKMTFLSEKAKREPSPYLIARDFECYFSYTPARNIITFQNDFYKCSKPGSSSHCIRNPFKEWCGGTEWDVDELTDETLRLSCKPNPNSAINYKVTRNYQIILDRQP
jgi:hypothetical protein